MLTATQAQRIMLFGLWKLARKRLMVRAGPAVGRDTWTKSEEDQLRHEFTKKVLGREKSWSELNRRGDVDLLKAGMMRIIQPDNVAAQIDQVGQETRRALWRVRQLMREVRAARAVSDFVSDESFLSGVIEQIEDGVDPNSPDAAWQRERERSSRRRSLDELSVHELKDVMDALRSIKRRQRDVASGSAAPKRRVREYILHPA